VPKKNLTQLTIDRLPAPPKGQVAYWDTQLTGFNVRISQGGAKTFNVVFGRDRRRITIGRYPIVSLAAARKRAREILLQAALHPAKQHSPDFHKALERYLKLKEPDLRASSFKEHKRLLETYFSWQNQVNDITTNDVLNALDAIAAPSEKAHAYAVLKTFFNWCVTREYSDRNPLEKIPKPKTAPPRERVLDERELAQLWDATHDSSIYHLIVRVLLLTGQRLNQIASLHQGWIDYSAKVINFPSSIMKTGQPHTFPFGPLLEFHLRQTVPVNGYLFSAPGKSGHPFSTFGKPKKRLDAACPMDPWTLHDLRRTWATVSAQLGTEPHIIERVLAHTTGSISKIAAIYNRFKYQDHMRAAVIRYENHILQLCAPM
jgi:integrase